MARRQATKSAGYLHRLLARLDRDSAQRIAPADIPKLIRAIEVCLLTGKTLTQIHEDGRDKLQGFEVVKIGLSPARAELYARLDARVIAMLNAGWLEEVRRHAEQGIPAAAKPFQFIGYSQLRAHQQGRATLDDAVKEIQQATRRYAKRQMTWFRREKDVQWFDGFGDDPKIAAQALQMLKAAPRLLASRRRQTLAAGISCGAAFVGWHSGGVWRIVGTIPRRYRAPVKVIVLFLTQVHWKQSAGQPLLVSR